MRRHQVPWSTLLLLGALLAPAQALAAPITRTVTANSISAVGMIGNMASVVSWNPNTGACTAPQTLSTTSGGLSGLTFLNGTSTPDWIFLVDFFGDYCGHWMTPLLTNGHILTLKGHNNNDVLDGRWTTNVALAGDANDDYITTQAGGLFDMWGFTGNDTMWGSSNSIMRGEADNDILCTQPGTTTFFVDGGSDDGGAESDKFCGSNPTWGAWSVVWDCSSC